MLQALEEKPTIYLIHEAPSPSRLVFVFCAGQFAGGTMASRSRVGARSDFW